MKKISIILFMSILMSMFFFSCKPKTIKSDAKEFAKKYYLDSDTSIGALKVEILIEIPVGFSNKSVLDSIRKTLITNLFSNEYVSITDDLLVEKFANELAVDYRLNMEPMISILDSSSNYSFNNEHILNGYSLWSDKNIYTYGIERFVYMGGAHGQETRNYFNFNLKTGSIITEKDIFVDNYQTELAELLKTRIIEQSKENIEIKDAESAKPIMSFEGTDFWTDSIKANGNFYLTEDGIIYVFNPFEIAPIYMGQTEVTIPFSRLSGLLKPNSPIAYLVDKQQ